MKDFINTCECCNKGYNFGNPYLCSDCITEDYYEESDFEESDYVGIEKSIFYKITE